MQHDTCRCGKRHGFALKYTDAPKVTATMHIALEDPRLDSLSVIIPGKARFKIHERIGVYGPEAFAAHHPGLG